MNRRRDDDNIGSFYMGRMRPPPKPQRVLPKGLLTTVSLAAFAIIIWYAYPQGQEKYEGMDVPVIKADTAPYKFKPDDPGGMEVLHQDSTVFEPLERRAEKVEKLMPQPEKPVDKAEAVDKALGKPKSPKLNLDLQMKPVAEGTEKVVSTKIPEKKDEKKSDKKEVKSPDKKPVAADKTKTAAPDVKTDAAKTETAKSEIIEPQSPASASEKSAIDKAAQKLKDEKEKAAATPAKKEQTAKVIAPQKEDGVIWDVWVRVGSYRSVAGAKEDWDMLRRKYPQYFGKLDMRTAKVDLGAKGVFHRLEAGKVSEARAREICKDLSKSNPGGCIVVK